MLKFDKPTAQNGALIRFDAVLILNKKFIL